MLLSGSAYVPTLYEKYYDTTIDSFSNKYDASILFAITANCTDENKWREILHMKKHNQNIENVIEYYKKIESCMWSLSREVRFIKNCFFYLSNK